MQHAAAAPKTSQTTTLSTSPDVSAGPHGAAIAPPTYGMDVVDSPPIQARGAAVQRQAEAAGVRSAAHASPAVNRTGLPDNLKASIESLSGLAMDDVRVHYNSARPAPLQALAYIQGTDIHVAPGQERHLPHEAWHVVQQKQGRVMPTLQAKGVSINDDSALEREADLIGAKAAANKSPGSVSDPQPADAPQAIVQRKIGFELETDWLLAEPKPARLLEMHKPIVKGKRWGLVPDTPGAELALLFPRDALGDIEFVTDAFEDDEMDELLRAMTEIVAFAKGLKPGWLSSTKSLTSAVQSSAGVDWKRKADPEDETAFATERKAREGVEVHPGRDPIAAKPQVSAGIPLDRVFDTLTSMSKGGEENPLDAAEADSLNKRLYVRSLKDANDITKSQGLNLAEAGIPAVLYKSILALLGTYIRYGDHMSTEKATYQKVIAPLLSRTNLGNIPRTVREYPNFLVDVLFSGGFRGGAAVMLGAAQTQRLFRNPFMSNITVHGWVSGIINGHDPLSWEQTQDGRWDPQEVGSGPSRREGFVFEFRGLREVPVDEWIHYTLMLFAGITNYLVNQREGAARVRATKSPAAKKNE